MPTTDLQVGSQSSVCKQLPRPWNSSGVLHEGKREGWCACSSSLGPFVSLTTLITAPLLNERTNQRPSQTKLRERAWQKPKEFMAKELSKCSDVKKEKKKKKMSLLLYRQNTSRRTNRNWCHWWSQGRDLDGWKSSSRWRLCLLYFYLSFELWITTVVSISSPPINLNFKKKVENEQRKVFFDKRGIPEKENCCILRTVNKKRVHYSFP